MENRFVDKVVDEIWGRWWSIPIGLIISILVTIPIVSNILASMSNLVTNDNMTYSIPRKEGIYVSAIVVICFLVLNTWDILFVISKNYIRKAKKGKTGILINIDADDSKVYKDTVRKFGEEFDDKLLENFEVVYVPYGAKKIEYRTKKIVPLLKKKRCILFLNIGINYDKYDESVIYDMKINGSIIHATYPSEIEKEFQFIFSKLLSDFRNIEFQSKEMIKRLRVTAIEMSFACEYIIGVSLFLNGDFRNAEIIFSEMVNRKHESEQWNKVCIGIQKMRNEMFMIYAMIYMEKYQRYCDDIESLNKVNEMLEKAKLCCGMTFEYCLNKAYYYIAKEHDSKKASELINICKQMKRAPKIWKYSEAFLKAYDNKAVGSILSSYKSALTVPYNIADLIVFIEKVLEREKNRTGLYLALAILYKDVGDVLLSNENFAKYISCASDEHRIREILRKKNLYSSKE